VISPN
jgi:hypothetical protein